MGGGERRKSVAMIVQKIPDGGFPGGSVVKNLPANAGDTVQSLICEEPTCCGATTCRLY